MSQEPQGPPPLPETNASSAFAEQPQYISRTIGCAVILLGGIAVIFLFSAIFGLFNSDYLGLTFYGLAFFILAAAAIAVRIIADRTYTKLVRGFYEAGKDWESESFTVFAPPSTPRNQRERDLIAWALDSEFSFYSVRKLRPITKLFFLMHFGKMREKIMKQYQQDIPDSDPLKYRYWKNLTPQQERHWQNYFSEHPDFRDFAGDRLYAPWAGLVWAMAMAGNLEWIVTGKYGQHELLIIDETARVDKNRSSERVKRTRVMVSSPYPLKTLYIAPEKKRDSLSDIDFESIEFNENFRVEADEKRWAYEVITPQTMALLLQLKGFVIEFDIHYIITHKRDVLLSLPELREAVTLLEGIANSLPPYLEDHFEEPS